jgi:hypothetical protein
VSGRLAKSLHRTAAASVQKDKRAFLLESLLPRIEQFTSASRAVRAAVVVSALISVAAVEFLVLVYARHIVWLSDFIAAVGFVGFAITIPLAFRYRARIGAFVRAISRRQGT